MPTNVTTNADLNTQLATRGELLINLSHFLGSATPDEIELLGEVLYQHYGRHLDLREIITLRDFSAADAEPAAKTSQSGSSPADFFAACERQEELREEPRGLAAPAHQAPRSTPAAVITQVELAETLGLYNTFLRTLSDLRGRLLTGSTVEPGPLTLADAEPGTPLEETSRLPSGFLSAGVELTAD